MLASMGRKAHVPPRLRRGPFTVDEARHAGLNRWHLEGASWTRIGPSTYLWAGLSGEPMHQLVAAKRRLPSGAPFSRLTAASLQGVRVRPCHPPGATAFENPGASAPPP